MLEVGGIRTFVFVCTDHYQWWSDHGKIPQAGKPLWVTEDDRDSYLHIFFDDNIKNKTDRGLSP